ncbi:protein THEM6-like isoform X2 [Cynoglossus semilaevis]|uniref:Protein THEM6 n=1 Tax=Cynoglossus semilaevis TaxID=244447 RepID=A0A3P8V3E0_CYNSE|nr:protein THEM6-like isoform X2 [Cynoglossus semilaevis]
MLVLVLVASLLLFSVFDVWYFLRAALAVVHAWFQPRIWDILAVQSFDGIVLPHDLDKLYHMNNSRYLRECDFARLHAYTRSRLLIALFKSGGGMVIGASTIRYRRSLEIWESFQIQTKIRGWDDKAFYLEQRFVSKRDGFVSAVMFSKQNVMNSSPEILISLASKMKVESPELPQELKYWNSFISASSQILRAESGLRGRSSEISLGSCCM